MSTTKKPPKKEGKVIPLFGHITHTKLRNIKKPRVGVKDTSPEGLMKLGLSIGRWLGAKGYTDTEILSVFFLQIDFARQQGLLSYEDIALYFAKTTLVELQEAEDADTGEERS